MRILAPATINEGPTYEEACGPDSNIGKTNMGLKTVGILHGGLAGMAILFRDRYPFKYSLLEVVWRHAPFCVVFTKFNWLLSRSDCSILIDIPSGLLKRYPDVCTFRCAS